MPSSRRPAHEPIRFVVNGIPRQVDAPEDTPLVHVLRSSLGLVGTRLGCGANQCGACNVLVDGYAVASCDTPLWAAAGKSIVTIEGLGSPEHPHPIQSALLAEQAGQCGYCLSGIAISAAALLARTPAPTRDSIRGALDGNLCRCGSHNRIVRAIERAALAMREKDA